MKINSFKIFLNKRNSLFEKLSACNWSNNYELYDALYMYIVRYKTIRNIDIDIPTVELECLCEDLWRYENWLKGKGGIYFLYDKENRLLNIGNTNDLYTRIQQKWMGKNYGSKADFYFAKYYYSVALFSEEDFYKRKLYEPYIINKLKPLLNDKFNYYDKSTYTRTLELEEKMAAAKRRPGLPSLGYIKSY